MAESKKFCYKFMFRKLGTLNNGDSKFAFYIDNEGFKLADSIISVLIDLKHFEEDEKDTYEKEKKIAQEEKRTYPQINIFVHSTKDILTGQVATGNKTYSFAQEVLMGDGVKASDPKYPIIHIPLTDLFLDSLYGNGCFPTLVPRAFQIMDSSIWNYMVPIFDIQYKDTHGKVIDVDRFQDVFYKAVDSIYKNYNKHLYDLQVAKEYADLNARLITEAYLSGAHSKGVSPFIFHSENVIKKMIKDEFRDNDNVIEKIKEKKWRLLLVDDKAYEKMEPKDIFQDDKDKYGYPWNCKIRIICDLLTKHFDLKDDDVRPRKAGTEIDLRVCKVLIDYVEDVDSAKKALKSREYDLILLDYLLDNHEYGYELLDDVYYHIQLRQVINDLKTYVKNLQIRYNDIHYSNANTSSNDSDGRIFRELQCNNELLLFVERYKKLNGAYNNLKNNLDTDILKQFLSEIAAELRDYRIGPCDRLFFMFISAYSSAVHERLLAEGLNPSEKYWHINVGACPTNTPQLFLYNLIKLMDKRLNDSHIRKLSVDGIVDILGKIYNQEGLIRKNAGEHYQDVQSYQYYYRTILKDYKVYLNNESIFDTEGSVLMTDFMKKNVNLGGLLEHMAQLVHLTAFGTVRQWMEMWEEYIYIKSQVVTQIKNENQSSLLKFETLCSNIESYIRSLKNSAI